MFQVKKEEVIISAGPPVDILHFILFLKNNKLKNCGGSMSR